MNSDIFLSDKTLIFLLLEGVVFFIQFIALYFAIKILRNWNFSSAESSQYKLEKQSYLVTLFVNFTLLVKFITYPYFIFMLDQLSILIPGAMCGAGVISANYYGEPLFILKTIILFVCGLWLIINDLDIKSRIFPYLKVKFFIYLILFLLIFIEFIIDIVYLSNLSTRSLVTCCSAIYSSDARNALPFALSLKSLLLLFYISFLASFISAYKKSYSVGIISNIIFIYFSYYAVIYFFGTYIYELPTHHCPFCMFANDYGYIGYFIFSSVFLGVFFGSVNFILKYFDIEDINRYFYYSNIFNTFFVLLCTYFVAVYYIKNGVLLH